MLSLWRTRYGVIGPGILCLAMIVGLFSRSSGEFMDLAYMVFAVTLLLIINSIYMRAFDNLKSVRTTAKEGADTG